MSTRKWYTVNSGNIFRETRSSPKSCRATCKHTSIPGQAVTTSMLTAGSCPRSLPLRRRLCAGNEALFSIIHVWMWTQCLGISHKRKSQLWIKCQSFSVATKDELPILFVLFHTLARIDEALRLTWRDVNFDHSSVTLWTRKVKKGSLTPRTVYMNDDLRGVLWGLWETKTQNEWVFLNSHTGTRYNHLSKFMHRICLRANIEPFGFHSIRHFVASYLLDRSRIGKKTVSEILGHRSLRTTDIYLHSFDESQRVAMGSLVGTITGPATGCGFHSARALPMPESAEQVGQTIDI